YKPDTAAAMFAHLAAYAEGDPATGKEALKALKNFSADGLRLNAEAREHYPNLSCLDAVQRVLESREDNAPPRTALLEHAAAWIARRVDAQRRATATMGFDDMLARLHDALADADHGER